MLKTQPESIDDSEMQDSVKSSEPRESISQKLRAISIESISTFSMDSLSKINRACNPFRLEKKQLLALEFLAFATCLASLIYALHDEKCYNDYSCFRNFMVGSFVCGVFLFILVLNHVGKFR